MKNTFLIVMTLVFALIGVNALAQTNNLFVRGDMNIKFNTKNSPTPIPGVKDVYNLNINVANSVLFHGTISDTPQIISGWVSKAVTQPRSLNYNLDCDVVNPHNPAQTRNIGRMYGDVPISSDGTYNYDDSSLVINTLPMGNAVGGTWKFSGVASGHPLSRPSNWMDSFKGEMVTISRNIGGKTMTTTLKKYDKMDFNRVVLAEGPVQFYQPVTVTGQMYYDYDQNCWFFNNFRVEYNQGNDVKSDRITGTIRWLPDAHRALNGLGEYEFDIRVNEPVPDDSAAFANTSSANGDESSFFTSNTSVPGLAGTMKYKDAFDPTTVDASKDPTADNATTTSSAVTIDLEGNDVTKQQIMVLGKVVIFAAIIPMNSN